MEVERSISQTEKFITISDKSDNVDLDDKSNDKSPLDGSDQDENLSQKSSSSNEEDHHHHKDSEDVKVVDQAKGNVEKQKDDEKILEVDLDNDEDEDDGFQEMEAKLNAFIEADKKQKEDKEEAKKKDENKKATQGGKTNGRIAQMLKNMPQYGKLLQIQPSIRPTSATDIDLDEDFFAPPPTRPVTGKEKGLQDLMNRFKLHTSVQKPKTEQHFKFHISKKEEDSQGVNRVQVDEIDYVKKLTTEEQEEMSSPTSSAPGVKMSEMKQKLMDEIRARRAQKYEEKLKTHAMYSEEKDLEGKSEEKDEEEILLDDEDITDEDEDEEEDDENEDSDNNENGDDDDEELDENKEEDIETLLNGEPDKKSKKKKKKQRKRLIFLEEEASESDEEGNKSVDEDEEKLDRANKEDLDFIDDRPISDDDDGDGEDSKGEANSDKKNNKTNNTDDNKDQTTNRKNLYPPSQGFDYSNNNTDEDKSQDILTSQPQSQDYFSQDLFSDFEREVESRQQNQQQKQQPDNNNTPSSPHPSLFDPTKTPIIPSSILNFQRASPIGPWNSTLTNRHQMSNASDIFRHPTSRMSPLMSRMSSDVALDVFCKDMNKKNSTTPTSSTTPSSSSTLPIEVAKLVGTQPSSFDLDEEFENICSAKFPSQPPETPKESQSESFGFDDEDDNDDDEEDDDLLAASNKFSNDNLSCSSSQTPINNNNHHNDSNNLHDQSQKHETPRTSIKNTIGSKRLDFLQMEEDGDDEKEDDDDDDDKNSIIGMKIQRKRKRCLKFSDDEDSDNENKPESDEDEEQDEEEETDAAQEEDEDMNNSEIEYDENEEIIVKPKFKAMVSSKTGKIRKEFVDGEAELSGSEIGSGDEDERGLDHYEDDGGDNEDFDEEKMKDEVGRMHLKQMIDDDQRAIRLLQDVYLEDGDLHTDGKGRERQFKWKNADQGGGEGMFISNGEYALGDDPDEIDAETRRIRERREKEEWKKQQREKNPNQAKIFDDDEEEVEDILGGSQLLKVNPKLLRKLEKQISYSESIHISNNNRCPTFVKKGSFLQREMSSISRLAEMTKINDSVAKASKQNFVFSVVTPPTNNNSSNKKTDRVKQPKKIIKVDNSVSKLELKSESQLFKWM